MRCCRLGRDAVAALAAGVVLTACAADGRGSTDDAAPQLSTPSAPQSTAASPPSRVPDSVDLPVIVTLAVSWQVETDLLDEEIAGQRERVRQA